MADILDYCSELAEIRFKSGQIMLPEGERLGKLLVLIEGQVEVIRERTQVTHVDEPGSIFGLVGRIFGFGAQISTLSN